jgi:putative aminopeptidase FrvX
VGFRGTLAIIYEKIVGSRNSIISLEASRQLPGARIGHGPVIRLGDKRTLFDSTVTSRLDQAAEHLQKHKKDFKIQRRIMNGGTCEATPFNLHNIRASGIAVPLGNYHNQRPSGGPGPEFIDVRDVEAAVELCVEFYRHIERKLDPINEFLNKLKKDFGRDKSMLRRRIAFKERSLA